MEGERVVLRACFNPCERGAKFSEELRAQAKPFAVVPRCRIKGIALCLRPNIEPGHLRPGTQALLNPFNDFLPRPRLARRTTMRSQAFLQEDLLPLLERHLIDTGCDAVPQRLHVVDLLFNGKGVESWRRQWQRLSHARTIPPDYRLLGSSLGDQDLAVSSSVQREASAAAITTRSRRRLQRDVGLRRTNPDKPLLPMPPANIGRGSD